MNKAFTRQQRAVLKRQLRNELTEALVYERLSKKQTDRHNRDLLQRIALDERRHAQLLSALLGLELQPDRIKAARDLAVANCFGLTFGLKLMEKGEGRAGDTYRLFADDLPELLKMAEDEDAHESALLSLLDDDRLNYMGAIVLGLNDALVELTGALAGFTFALSGARIIAMTGLITGFAAAMSMAASAFLSARAGGENLGKNPVKTAIYTGLAYILTVFALIVPYLTIPNVKIALVVMLALALTIIAGFNFYLSIAKDTPFRKSFLEMAGLSTFVATVSFGIGYLLNHFFGVGG
jgi:VIT1/CCC1 family predicted Fe2+/Mn2+ transporter